MTFQPGEILHLFHWRFPGGEEFGLYRVRKDADKACEDKAGSEVISLPVLSTSGFQAGQVLTGASGDQYVLERQIGYQDDRPCDAPDSATVSVVDGRCRCLVCSRCGHHTGNSHQGHYWALCKLTGTDRGFHFCCPGNCELGCPDCQGTGIVDAPNDCGGCCDYPGVQHEPACGIEPCPRGCPVPAPTREKL